MNKEAVAWATEQDIPNPYAKSLLIAIATYADKQYTCFPSYRTLSKQTGMGYSTVAKYIRLLNHFGFIKVAMRIRETDGGRTSNFIFLAVNKAKEQLLYLAKRKATPRKRRFKTPHLRIKLTIPRMVDDRKEEAYRGESMLSGEYMGIGGTVDKPVLLTMPDWARSVWRKCAGLSLSDSEEGVQFA